ncbi:MAG: hypothetical protein IJT59_03115, partial [Desulfovibrionaceae bacterium]|nr:hypothetical protein [Desulfovibrionaceae bacterium]
GYVLEVLLRKHESIRKALGISVPFPEDSDKVMQAILQGVLLRQKDRVDQVQQLLPGIEDFYGSQKKQIEEEWDRLAAREQKRSRTIFAQQSIKVDDVALELASTEEASGNAATVEKFLSLAVRRLGGVVNEITEQGIERKAHRFSFDPHVRLKHRALDLPETITVVYDEPVFPDQELITRTHPLVESIANYVFETTMDSNETSLASRSGVMSTDAVKIRSTLLLCRFRYEMTCKASGFSHTDLSEECYLLAFTGSPQKAVWQDETFAKSLLLAKPKGNINPSTCATFLSKINADFPQLLPHIRDVMNERAARFLKTHRRIRDAAKFKGGRYDVSPKGEPDLIGVFVFLPVI